jgi:glycosyltransferase involved in cell wall biosynthesis
VRRPDWRFRCGLPDAPLVTYLARLTADKGVHRFLNAVSEIPREEPFSAIVGGTGPEEEAVRTRIATDESLTGRVRYVGPVAEEEKAALLSQSDLFVIPSTSDTASVALLEAMACGAACVVSDVGGPRDLVVGGASGRLVSVDAPRALSGAISDLLRDPGARARLRTDGVAYVQRHASIEATAERFLAIYRRVSEERRHGTVGATD